MKRKLKKYKEAGTKKPVFNTTTRRYEIGGDIDPNKKPLFDPKTGMVEGQITPPKLGSIFDSQIAPFMGGSQQGEAKVGSVYDTKVAPFMQQPTAPTTATPMSSTNSAQVQTTPDTPIAPMGQLASTQEDLMNQEPMVNDMSIYNSKEQRNRMSRNASTNSYDENGNPLDNDGDERTQFFNQYAGVDIPTAAFTLGQSIKDKDALGIVSSGAKVGLGLARNFFSGMGQANRENYVKQDMQNTMRNNLKPKTTTMYQVGGYAQIDDADVDIINRGTGITFDPEFAKSYFTKASDQEQVAPIEENARVRTPIDWETQKIVDITSDGQFKDRKIWMTNRPEYFTGRSEAIEGTDYERIPYKKWEDFQKSPSYRNYKDGYPTEGLAVKQDGGEQDQMMQEVAQALQQGVDPQQVIQQLIQMGMSEEQAVQLIQQLMQQQSPEQQMMRDGGTAKILTGEYTQELKNDPNPKVAEVEDAEFIKTPQGEVTQVDGQTHERGGVELNAKQLPDNSQIISDHLKVEGFAKQLSERYDLKVKPTDTYAKAVEKFTQKIGLKKLVEEQEEQIKKLQKQSEKLIEAPNKENTVNINVDFLQRKIKELEDQKAPLEEQRKMFFDEVFSMQESKKQEAPQEGFMESGGVYNGDMVMQYANKYGIAPQRAKELLKQFQDGGMNYYQGGGRQEDMYKQAVGLGYTGANEIGAVQNWYAQNYSNEVVNYFNESGQPLTAKHVDILKQRNAEAFKKAGIPANKPSASYTEQEKQKLKEASGDFITSDFLLEGFQDQKFDWRFPVIASNLSVKPEGLQGQGISAEALYGTQSPTPTNPSTEEEEEAKKKGMGLFLLPDQSRLGREVPLPTLLQTPRYERVEAPLATADPMIQEIRRQEQSAMQAVNSLPDAEKAAAVAQIQANTQNEIGKIMNQVQGQNIQSTAQANTTNAQIQSQEENQRIAQLLGYENRMFTTLAKTDAINRARDEADIKTRVGNFNTINNLNLMNQAFENTQLSSNGNIETINSPQLSYDGAPQAPKTPEEYKKEYDRLYGKKKAVAKKGGRFKKKLN